MYIGKNQFIDWVNLSDDNDSVDDDDDVDHDNDDEDHDDDEDDHDEFLFSSPPPSRKSDSSV